MSEGNGNAPKVVASFTVTVTDQGQVQRHVEGPFPIHLLNMALDMQKFEMAQQIAFLEAQQRQRQGGIVHASAADVPPVQKLK